MRPTYADPVPASMDHLTAEDAALLAHAIKWLPFDTGDEYIFPDFGVTPLAFYHRIVYLDTYGQTSRLLLATRNRLRDICERKIADLTSPQRHP